MHLGIDARLPAYQMGGISQYVIHLVRALAELDTENRYTIFHSRKDGRSRTPSAANFRGRSLWTPCHHRYERQLLAVELLIHRPDVWHSPDFIPPAAGAKRRVITVHDLNFLFYPAFLTEDSRRYYAGQIQWAVQAADAIAADSEATRQDLIDRLAVEPGKVRTIHLAANPVYEFEPPETAVAQTLRKHNLPRGFILFVGTLEPRKNLPTLLRAYGAMCREKGIDLPLVLVGGKGWMYDDVFATIDQLGLTGRVQHLSGVTNQELAHLYHGAGVLVLPSFYEGFGLPVLEAMHCGCPVIASDRASLPEVVGEAGLLLDPEDVTAWADDMARVVSDDDLRRAMVQNGRIQARKFTWRKTAVETLKLYLDQ